MTQTLPELADRFIRLEDEYARTCWAYDDCDDRFNTPEQPKALADLRRACSQGDKVGKAIIAAKAVTIEDVRAKARAAARWFGGDGPTSDGLGTDIMWSIVRDLVGEEMPT